jgi:FkbM family methyltransferase
VGTYAVLASGVCGATTWAFEPDPGTVHSLKRNIAINNLDELVRVYDLALGDADAEIPFTVGHDTHNRVAGAGEKNVRMVRQQRLDALVGGGCPHPIIMMKIDVEGYEEEVIRGAKALLENDCLKIIVLEWPKGSWIWEELLGRLFKRAYYEPFSRKLQLQPVDTFSSPNSLFVRDWDFVSSRLTTASQIKILGHSI